MNLIRAVIDVGTNSVKLLVAELAGSEVRPVFEESRQTRLGQGFYTSHRLQPEPIAKTAAAVAEFAGQARELGALSVRVIATSAAREAGNRSELLAAIERSSQLPVQIISGAQEANWAYEGVCTDPALARTALVLLDIGGGSMEVIVGHDGKREFSRSYEIGTVRLLERLHPGDPPATAELGSCRDFIRKFLQANVQPALEPFFAMRPATPALPGADPAPRFILVGTGGTASILGCMEATLDHFDRERLESTRLSLERLRWHVEHLWRLPLEQRKQVVGLPKNRADVILTGTAIFEAVAELFGFRELRISTRGLRFAAVAQTLP